MTLRLLFLAFPLMLLAACGGGGGTGGNAAAPSAPVAAVAPPAGQQWTDIVSKTPAGGYVMGNPNAAVKLVEYGSRTCPTCGNFGRTGMQPLEQNYVKTGKVSYEFRDFMVHAPDLGVDLLGRCGGAKPFFPLLEQMYQQQMPFLDKLENLPADMQQKLSQMSPTQAAAAWVDYLGYVDFVKQRGISEQQARACLADPAAIKEVSDMTQTAMDNDGITGTPTFVLNGQKLGVDVVTWDRLEQQLKAAGA